MPILFRFNIRRTLPMRILLALILALSSIHVAYAERPTNPQDLMRGLKSVFVSGDIAAYKALLHPDCSQQPDAIVAQSLQVMKRYWEPPIDGQIFSVEEYASKEGMSVEELFQWWRFEVVPTHFIVMNGKNRSDPSTNMPTLDAAAEKDGHWYIIVCVKASLPPSDDTNKP